MNAHAGHRRKPGAALPLVSRSGALLLLVFATLLLAACSAPQSASGEVSTGGGDAQELLPVAEGTDYTVERTEAYWVDTDTATVGMRMDSGEAEYAIGSSSVAQLRDNSEVIVLGTVENVRYVCDGGLPHIFWDLRIADALKGAVGVGDRITLAQMGGYISIADYVAAMNDPFDFQEFPEDEWASTWIVFTPAENAWPQEGKEYAYFLVDNDVWAPGSEILGDTYTPLCDAEGSFAKTDDGSYVRPSNSEGITVEGDASPIQDSFTLDDLHRYFGTDG
jgi:hypothetical protein